MTQRKWIVRLLIGGTAIFGFFFTLVLLLFREIPEVNRDAIQILLGAMGGYMAAVISYYFGDSDGPDTQ